MHAPRERFIWIRLRVRHARAQPGHTRERPDTRHGEIPEGAPIVIIMIVIIMIVIIIIVIVIVIMKIMIVIIFRSGPRIRS